MNNAYFFLIPILFKNDRSLIYLSVFLYSNTLSKLNSWHRSKKIFFNKTASFNEIDN